MADGRVNSFGTPELFSEFAQAKADLREIVGLLIEANTTAKKVEGFTMQANSIKDLHTSEKALVDVQGRLIAATDQLDGKWKEALTLQASLNGHTKETIQNTQELVKLNILEERLLKTKNAATKAQADAYGQLSKQYNEAARAAQNLAAQYGVGDARAKAAAKSANDLSDKLKAIDSSVGRNQRKVGEYENATKGLSGSLMSLSQGFRNSGNEIDALGRILGFSKGTLDDFRVALEHGTRTLAVFFDAFGKKLAGKAVEEVDDLTAAVDEQTDALKDAVVEKAKEAASEKINTVISGENTVAVEANAAATVSAGVAAAANSVALDANTIAMHSNVAAYTVQIAQGRAYAVVGAINTATTEANAVALGEATIAQGALATATTATTIATRLLTITLLASGVGAIIALVGLAIYAYNSWRDATESERLAHEALNKALDSTDYKGAIESMAKLTDSLKLAKQGLIDKTDVVDEYNKSIGEAAGKVTDLDGVEQGLVAHKDAYVQMMLYKAAAAEAYKEAADKAVKSQTALGDVGQMPDFMDFAKSAATFGRSDPNIIASKRRLKEADEAKKQSDKLLIIGRDFNKKMAEEAQKNGLDSGLGGNVQAGSVAALRQQITVLKQKIDTEKAGSAQQIADTKTLIELEKQLKAIEGHTTKGPRPHDDTNAQLKGETDYTAALFEQFKLRSAKSAAEQKAIADDETNNLQKRADAYANYTNERLNEAGLESAKERSIIQQKLDKIAEIEGKAVGKRTNEEKNLLFSKQALEVQLVNTTDKYEGVRTGIIEENAALQAKLIKQYGKDGEDAIKQSIKNLNSLGAFFQGNTSETDSQEKRDARLERSKFYIDASISVAKDLASVNTSLAQRRIQEIDAEIDKINERRDAEIAAIEKSGLSATQKEAKIADAKARAEAKTKELEQERQKRARRAAEFEKAITIAQIIANTALAVVKQLQIPGAGTGLALATAAIGAAQLAAAIAAPLPAYAEGTGEDYVTGKALTDEEGAEGYQTRSGKFYLGSNSGPTVRDFKEPTKIIPADIMAGLMEETMQLSKYYAVGIPHLIQQQQGNGLNTERIEKGLGALKQAIDNKPVAQLNVTGMGMQHLTKSANQITQYVTSFSA